MRIYRTLVQLAVLGTALALSGGPSTALDPATLVTPDAAPTELFTFGFKAYQRGEKHEAFEALKYAAEKGHAGARWKLGRMYAEGDGVKEDDYAAFKIFEAIVREQEDDTSNSPNAAYVASAIVALGNYLCKGIPDSPVSVNLPEARQLYFHAATFFGDPEAQFELGRMLLNGDGGRANPRQAARWLKLASEKGHAGAQALLGYLLFDGKKIDMHAEPVQGLALLTTALKHASASEQKWIRPMQEEAFSLANETVRRTALAYAEEKQTAKN